jgi:two-component system sensor histidine kinase UhpB
MTRPNLRDTPEPASGAAIRVLPTSGAAGVSTLLGVGVACFLAQWVAVALWVPPANVSTVWIPGGLMLAIALLTEPRRWPSVITAGAAGVSTLFLVLRLVPPAGAILLGVIDILQTVAVASVLRAAIRPPLSLATRREFLIYLGVAVIGGAVLASTMLLIAAAGLRIRPATFMFWRTFALAVVLGYLTMTPTVVLLARQSALLTTASVRRGLEAAILALLLALVSGLVFSGAVDRLAMWAVFAMAFPPLLLWSAMRFGTLGASAALLIVAVVSTASTSRGMGPFAGQSPGDNTLSLQLFILGIGVPLLGLAVVLSEEQRGREALQSSHAEMRELNRKLIAAREEEASRIARELHDDVGQRLALVSIGLGRLRQVSPEAAGPSPVVKLQEQTSAIARSLRQISHQLHPAALEHAGLASALELKCEEVRQATNLEVALRNRCDPSAIPQDVALCLYRVVQEALNNVIRHAGARRVDVLLRLEGSHLALRVTDDGRGFDPAPAGQGTGLGLRSAAERVAAVGGRLMVDSAPGAGTTVRVAIPLNGERDA